MARDTDVTSGRANDRPRGYQIAKAFGIIEA